MKFTFVNIVIGILVAYVLYTLFVRREGFSNTTGIVLIVVGLLVVFFIGGYIMAQ